MVNTSDPVSLVEIAARTGLPRERVSGWKKRGQLPAPDWVRGRTGLWAWETLSLFPLIAQHLEDADSTTVWHELFDALGDRGQLRSLSVPEAEWAKVSRQIEHQIKGCVSVPVRGERLVVTDASLGSEIELAVATTALAAALDVHRAERAESSVRSATPAVSTYWTLGR